MGEQKKCCGELLHSGDGVHKETNIEKLVSFAEELDTDGDLIPVFLAILEVSLNGKEHGFQEFHIGVG